ncbi:hypothetical protein NQ176_g6868 [Zarea fungicola]|uniref:Uncharacterized protein n=1 Tax=Zarea fungicola TaxID=93591 RepID=A0ACC1N0Z3_9HYPO|nr:hypothetical protein NQ176_g6868 [Lecanicillium fungicola]
MKLTTISVLCSLAASAQSASWLDTPENASIAEFMIGHGGGDISAAEYSRATETALHSRATMDDGKWYSGKAAYWGWAVQVGRCLLYEYPSKWVLPSPSAEYGNPINSIATQFANALANIKGEGVNSQNIGGGWAMTAIGSSQWRPKDIPWNLAYDMMWDASTSASGWLSADNGVYWTLKDTAGDVIYTFLVWPLNAVGKNPYMVHDEQ